MTPPDRDLHARELTGFQIWKVPTAVWFYGSVRAAGFAVAGTTGPVGALDVSLILALYLLLVRGSRTAWVVLIAVDVASFGLLVLTTRVGQTPLLVHILFGSALVTLLLPSIRRYVSGRDAKGRTV